MGELFMRRSMVFLFACLLFAGILGVLFSSPVRAADDSDPDVTFSFTPYTPSGEEITDYPYGYMVSITGDLEDGTKLSGTYSYVDSDGNTGKVQINGATAGQVPVPFGKTVTVKDLPENVKLKLRLSRIRRFTPSIKLDNAYESYKSDVLDSDNSIVLDSDKNVHYKIDTTNLYTSFSILPKNFEDSWSSDTTFNFHMYFSDLEDLDTTGFYYTVGEDPTQHKPVPDGNRLVVDVNIPLGSKLTLHNIPTGAFFGGNDYTFSEYSNIIWDSVRQSVAGDAFGFTDTPGGASLSSGVVSHHTSGTWIFYLGRRSTCARIIKKIDNPVGSNPDELFDFKVTLYDTVLDRPLTGKVEVITGSPLEADKMMAGDTTADASVRMYELDGNGAFVLSLKANEVAIVGRLYDYNSKPWELVDPGNGKHYFGPNGYTFVIRDNGMIPVYTKFTIEELDNGYKVNPWLSNTTGDRQLVWSTTNTSRQDFFYANERVYDSALSLEKVVEGKNGTFDFTIRLKDVASDLPTTYAYTGDKKGDITFNVNGTEKGTRTGGDGRTSNITYTIYEANISLEGGQKIKISDLPSGTEYEVIEKTPAGYTVTSSGKTGMLASGKTSDVVFTNKEATPTPTATATPVPTVTTVPTATPTPGATVTPTATPAVTVTPSVTPGATSTPAPTVTPTKAPDATPTATEAPSATPSATVTPTVKADNTATPTPTKRPKTTVATGEGTSLYGFIGITLLLAAGAVISVGRRIKKED